MSHMHTRSLLAVNLIIKPALLILGIFAFTLFSQTQFSSFARAQNTQNTIIDAPAQQQGDQVGQDGRTQEEPAQNETSNGEQSEQAPIDEEQNGDATVPEKTVTEVIDEAAPNDLARPGEEALKKIEALKLELDRLESALRREELTDDELKNLREELRPIDDEVLAISALVTPLVKQIDKRIAELGPTPEGGAAAETESVKAERELQSALQSEIYGTQTEINLISLRAAQLSRVISERRRILFSNRIFERRQTMFDGSLWNDLVAALPIASTRINLLMEDGYRSLRSKLPTKAVFFLFLVLLSGVVLVPIARRIRLWIGVVDEEGNPSTKLRKLAGAAWTSFAICAIPTVTAANFFAVINAFGPFNDRVEIPLKALVIAVFLISATYGLCSAILAPNRPSWRLASLPDYAARRAMYLIVSAAVIFAIDYYLSQLNSVLFTPLSLTVSEGAIADLLIAVLLGLALRALSKGQQTLVDPDSSEPPSQALLRWRWVQFACWIAVLAIPVSQAFGYLSLSQFIATQLAVTGIIMGALILAMMVMDEALTRGIGDGGDESMAEQIGHTLGVQRNKIELLAILLNGLLKITLIIVAMTFLLVPWGFESKDIFTWIRSAFFGISIGGLTFSMASIFSSILIFFIILVVTRSIQNWLEHRFLPYTDLDIGIRTSLKTAFGYAGVILAVTLGLTYLGFDLSNLAIVAGALSLGIGFGLQSIVNNFVSGLILLVERPIKVGDWIVVGTDEGYVQKISVRSTEIQTFDNASVIVPNSDLISGVVTNWMHKDMKGRVRIPIGVAYDSDPVQVQDILMEIAVEHPAVLQRPQPRVYFMEFGQSSLDFELRVHLRNVDTGMSVKSDLRTSILTRLRAENIEIPYPQQDVHLKDIDRISGAMGEKIAKPARRKAPAKPRSTKGKA